MYKPPSILSPGDVFSDLPTSYLTSPLKISRKSGYTPPAERGPQEFRRIYTHPANTGNLNPSVSLNSQKGEECLAVARVNRGILLTYACTVDADLDDRKESGPKPGVLWHLAPIFDVGKIPKDAAILDEATGESVLMRNVVTGNLSANYFYLNPLPGAKDQFGHYVDFRKATPVPIEYVIEAKNRRLVTLNDDALNGCLAQFMWFFTRARYLREPVPCPHCGKEVNLIQPLEGQNLDLNEFQK